VFRIDSPSAVPSIPITPPPFAPGFFTDGNPASGAEATIVDAWWLNMVQEEILTVITSIGMAADKADSSQLYQAIQRIAEAANPDLAGFLPLSGGALYRPGGGDLLTIRADQQAAPSLHARLVTTVIGVRTWACGTDSSGAFSITDITGDVVRLTLGTGGVFTYNGPANITGNLTGNTISAVGDVSAGNNLVAANIVRVGGQGVQYPALGNAHNIGWVFDGSFLGFRVDGQFSGGFVVPGAIQSSSLVVSGNTALNTWTSGSGTVDGNLVVNYNASLGSANIHGHCQGNTWQFGSGTVIGNLDCGGDGSFVNITGHNQVVTNYFRCTTADIQGNTVIGGQLDINGGGFIYAINRCYRGYEINLDPGGIFSAAHGASYQGGPWNTSLVLHTRAEAIEPYEHGLAALRQLQPMIYSERRLIGIASEDYRGPMPEMVVQLEVEDDGIAAALRTEPPKTVEGYNGGALTYALVNAVKELAERIEELERAWPAPAPA
jgi:hypothetical protein